MMRFLCLSGLLAALSIPAWAEDRQLIAKLRTDLVGNAVEVEAIDDPKVVGVTCYWTHFSRSLLDRMINMGKSSVFLDPSNSGIACARTGAQITIGKIELDEEGEEIGSEKTSLFFRDLKIVRIYDPWRKALVYVSYSTRLTEGSAKSAVSVVSLEGLPVTWASGRAPTPDDR